MSILHKRFCEHCFLFHSTVVLAVSVLGILAEWMELNKKWQAQNLQLQSTSSVLRVFILWYGRAMGTFWGQSLDGRGRGEERASDPSGRGCNKPVTRKNKRLLSLPPSLCLTCSSPDKIIPAQAGGKTEGGAARTFLRGIGVGFIRAVP